jgi:hypothetical protein
MTSVSQVYVIRKLAAAKALLLACQTQLLLKELAKLSLQVAYSSMHPQFYATKF